MFLTLFAFYLSLLVGLPCLLIGLIVLIERLPKHTLVACLEPKTHPKSFAGVLLKLVGWLLDFEMAAGFLVAVSVVIYYIVRMRS